MSLSGNLNVLGKIQKRTKRFLSQQKNKATKIDKDCDEKVVTISYKIKFIDSARFMATSLSNFIDNITERIRKIKCKN